MSTEQTLAAQAIPLSRARAELASAQTELGTVKLEGTASAALRPSHGRPLPHPPRSTGGRQRWRPLGDMVPRGRAPGAGTWRTACGRARSAFGEKQSDVRDWEQG